jgi:hypothetical protein
MVLALALTASVASADLPAPRKVVAVLDVGWRDDYYPRMQTVSFFDITTLSGSSVFDDQPLFSAWVGFEYKPFTGAPEDTDLSSMAVNPTNGDVYLLEYDGGTGGIPGDGGDTDGDYDLYKIDYQVLLDDWVGNGRNKGVVYCPSVGPDGTTYKASGLKHYNSSLEMVYVDSGIAKIGEIARNGDMTGMVSNAYGEQRPNTGGTDYFTPDLDFVNARRLVMLDDQDYDDSDSDFWFADSGNPTDAEQAAIAAIDHRIVSIDRVAATSGSATHTAQQATDREGGYNGQTTQSWETTKLGLVNMDGYFSDNGTPGDDSDDFFQPTGVSEAFDMQYVARDGMEGVWVAEGDTPQSSSDDVDLFKFLPGNGGMTYHAGFRADETSDPNDNNGDVDWIKVRPDGAVVVGESGYYDTPVQEEPRFLTRTVEDYNDASGIDWDAAQWTVAGPVTVPAGDKDDSGVIHGQFPAYDPTSGNVMLWDIDGAEGGYEPDVYVFDSAGNLIYSEVNAADLRIEEHGLEIFLRGDVDQDGDIDQADLTLLTDTRDGTDGLLKEQYDLTGDANVTTEDLVALVADIAGLEADASLDGSVDTTDLARLAANWQSQSATFVEGDFTRDGSVDTSDLAKLAAQWNMALAGAGSKGAVVPEPMTVSLVLAGAIGLVRRRRK